MDIHTAYSRDNSNTKHNSNNHNTHILYSKYSTGNAYYTHTTIQLMYKLLYTNYSNWDERSKPLYKLVGSSTQRSGWGLFLLVCLYHTVPVLLVKCPLSLCNIWQPNVIYTSTHSVYKHCCCAIRHFIHATHTVLH